MIRGEIPSLPQAYRDATRQSESNNGKSARPSRSPRNSKRCPECGSERVWKDGIRYTKHGEVQRWLCRDCFLRFSKSTAQLQVKVNVASQIREASKPRDDLTHNIISKLNPARKEALNNFSFFRGEDVASHKRTVVGQGLNSLRDYNSTYRVCATNKGAKNLEEKPQIETFAGDTKPDYETAKGLIVKYMAWLENQGYKSAKNRVNMMKRLVDLGANLWNPESIKQILTKREDWKDGYKMLMTYAYEGFLKMEGLSWERPRYKQEEALPFIPTEEELDQLITGAGKKVGIFLQGLKDTGADPGELAKLRWIDVNEGNRTANIRPVKGHNPRILKVSSEFVRRLQTMPRESEYIFNYDSLRSGYADAKKHLTRKLNNPRLLSITFTTFRHWKGTMEYHKTRDILHVKQLLGHKKIQSTMIYVNLELAIFTDRNDEFHVAVAKNVEEASNLVKVGFEYVTGEYNDGGKIFRKRK